MALCHLCHSWQWQQSCKDGGINYPFLAWERTERFKVSPRDKRFREPEEGVVLDCLTEPASPWADLSRSSASRWTYKGAPLGIWPHGSCRTEATSSEILVEWCFGTSGLRGLGCFLSKHSCKWLTVFGRHLWSAALVENHWMQDSGACTELASQLVPTYVYSFLSGCCHSAAWGVAWTRGALLSLDLGSWGFHEGREGTLFIPWIQWKPPVFILMVSKVNEEPGLSRLTLGFNGAEWGQENQRPHLALNDDAWKISPGCV